MILRSHRWIPRLGAGLPCLVLVSALASGSSVACAQDPPARVTTDTADYCRDLARRADAHDDAPANARELSLQGRRLCEQGQVVAGIARLRRALMVMGRAEAPR